MPAVDNEVMTMLKEVMAEEFPVLLETFISDSRHRISQLDSLVADREWDLIRGNAHSLKGSSSNIGALELSEVCLTLEQRGKNREDNDLEGLLADLKSKYAEVEAALNSLL